MDRLAQTALSAIRQMQDNKFDLANNLANVNVPGFRKDLPNEGNAGFLKELEFNVLVMARLFPSLGLFPKIIIPKKRSIVGKRIKNSRLDVLTAIWPGC